MTRQVMRKMHVNSKESNKIVKTKILLLLLIMITITPDTKND